MQEPVRSRTVISAAVQEFLDIIEKSRSEHTRRAHANRLNKLAEALEAQGLEPKETPVAEFPEEVVILLADLLKDFAPATEKLYLAAVMKFCTFLEAEEYVALNLSRQDETQLPYFSADDVRAVINYVGRLPGLPADDDDPTDFEGSLRQHLLNLRDWALIVTLADTGLRVHEACGLIRGQIDWNEGKTIVRGKGGKEAVIRFSNRSLGPCRAISINAMISTPELVTA